MLILGIESSCDDTGVALVNDGKNIIHNTLISQTEIHSTFGGIVPEVAARQHIIALGSILKEYKDLNLLEKEIKIGLQIQLNIKTKLFIN